MDRRDFLTYSVAGAVTAALLPASAFASSVTAAPAPTSLTEHGSVMRTEGRLVRADLPLNAPSQTMRYMTPQRFGMGGTQIGNIFAPISDVQAGLVLQAAWDAGVRLYDTSPFYGFGLSEYRLGRFLHDKDPDDYVISTKVGRVLTAAGGLRADHAIWKSPAPFNYQYDYTAAGTRRSVEDSLQRLGLPRIDIVLSTTSHQITPSWKADGKRRIELRAQGRWLSLKRCGMKGSSRHGASASIRRTPWFRHWPVLTRRPTSCCLPASIPSSTTAMRCAAPFRR